MSVPAPNDARRPNRLIRETSPYLLQHAYNPVDWYPWGPEAFDRARQEDKPVFLSVGYSACHWCHVMEHESFEDESIAALMNEHFINIKVDREERPDIDQIYMSAVQLITQRGGWPMSVFLTPDQAPFYGGTYWPPASRMGMPGFADILQQIHEVWEQRRDEVTSQAQTLVAAVDRVARATVSPSPLDEGVLENAMRNLVAAADRRHGGFGSAPKFPHPMDIRVLLRCWKRFGGTPETSAAEKDVAATEAAGLSSLPREALDVARLTLEKMARGGIYDHLGGGFHRYSTDATWLVPHFEKMLYDNALLVPAYLEAFQMTGDPLYARVATETLDYVLREMTAPEGGFFSTQDADSEGEEGKFFVWSVEEVRDILGPEEARLFCAAFDVTPAGNWEGRNILNRPKAHDEVAALLEIDPRQLERKLDRGRASLLEARSRRIPPGRDEKVLVAWNGWMISAMAMGAAVLGEERFLAAAMRGADFVLTQMRDERGQLWHVFKDGESRIPGFLDDYAGFIDGLVDLYQASGTPGYLVAARELAAQMLTLFADDESAGFYYTPADHETLITRTHDTQDGATPSGNSLAALALLKLGRLSGDSGLLDRAALTLETLSGLMAEHPRAAGQALIALDMLLGPTCEIVVVEGRDAQLGEALIRELHQRFVPNKLVAYLRTGDRAGLPPQLALLFQGREPMGGQTTAYVCRDQVCSPPITEPDAVWPLLEPPSAS